MVRGEMLVVVEVVGSGVSGIPLGTSSTLSVLVVALVSLGLVMVMVLIVQSVMMATSLGALAILSGSMFVA